MDDFELSPPQSDSVEYDEDAEEQPDSGVRALSLVI